MFWADSIADEVERRYGKRVSADTPLIIRDEKTASGRVHVGSTRSASLHGLVSEILTQRGFPNVFHFEINDFDPMDGIPADVDKTVYEQYLGMPLYKVPAPDGISANFAEQYGQEYVSVIKETGFTPVIYRASELYRSGRMNEVIKTALERRDVIRRIYKEESGGERPDTWYPLNVVCEHCGKHSTTQVTSFDGERVKYECKENAVAWTKGCGNTGEVSPFDGNAKLPWKVEWAAKFKVVGVQFEGAGKDHYTKGGARQVADRIARDVFEYEPPYGVANEFFLIGGAKMSSSKGNASSAREIADLLPPHIFRLALFKSDIARQINFDPEGDTVPVLFDTYDKYAEKYWSGANDDDARVFEVSHRVEDAPLLHKRFLPRFSQVAFMVQMPHLSLEEEAVRLKGSALTEEDFAELTMRTHYAEQWLSKYAPEKFRFVIQETVPASVADFSDIQKRALSKLHAYVLAHESLDGDALHHALHTIKEEEGIAPAELFRAIYQSFLGRDSGPQAGWFLSTLKRDFLLDRLAAVSA